MPGRRTRTNATAPVESRSGTGWPDRGRRPSRRADRAYNAQQDKVRVTLENQVGSKETFDKYVQSSQDGRPDLVLLPEYVVQQMADGGTVIPIGACVEESGYDTSEFLPGALDAYRTDGVQWSMPFNVSTPVLFFNERTFERCRARPDQPTRVPRAVAPSLAGDRRLRRRDVRHRSRLRRRLGRRVVPRAVVRQGPAAVRRQWQWAAGPGDAGALQRPCRRRAADGPCNR